MDKIKISIDGMDYQVEKGLTILEAARSVGIDVPSLCYYKDLIKDGSCRVCLVEVKGNKNLTTACNYEVFEGMEIKIASPKAMLARKKSVELILSNHNSDCVTCNANFRCELQKLAKNVGVKENFFKGIQSPKFLDNLSPSIQKDTSKCITCGRCVAACKKYQGLGILDFMGRGFNTTISTFQNKSFKDVPCMYCGQCVNVCPTGALSVKEEINDVLKAMVNKKHVIVQVAPAVRASLGEEFGLPIGTRVTGKMCAALRRLGFSKIYDTNFAADLTIMEEGGELIHRIVDHLQGKEVALPMITSCSPGWVRYAEFQFGDHLNHLSTCKSPHMMMGAILKTWYAQCKNIDPKEIFVVSIMPCSAKKSEIDREEMQNKDGIRDVDAVLTTRELGDLIKSFDINFNSLPNEGFDQDLFGEYSGAGVIFGVSGGVMEAALRTAYAVLQNKEYGPIVFDSLRNLDGIKEAVIPLKNIYIRGKQTDISLDLKIAIASSMVKAAPLLEEIKNGTSPYHFIEIMGCPSGCINGGGQSFLKPGLLRFEDKCSSSLLKRRADALYEEDQLSKVRVSHQNSQIIELYKNFLEKPGSSIAHELLHTHYQKREKFK